MPGSSQRTRTRCRGYPVAPLVFALFVGGCSSGGTFGGPAAAPPEAAPTSPGLSDKISTFFSGSTAKAPQTVSGAQPDVNCPSVEIRRGASTLTLGPTGDKTAMSLKYQGEFTRAARECSIVGGNIVMKIGVQGRVIVGPAGGPGRVDVPLRFAIVQETPGGTRPIMTKFTVIPTVIGPNEGNALFTHIEEAMSFPLPTPTALLDDYIVYIGFDPLSAEAQAKQSQPSKPSAKARPATSAN
jgi:hypothetical protein